MHGSGLACQPKNKMLNKNIMGTVGESWVISVDSVKFCISVIFSDTENCTVFYQWKFFVKNWNI